MDLSLFAFALGAGIDLFEAQRCIARRAQHIYRPPLCGND